MRGRATLEQAPVTPLDAKAVGDRLRTALGLSPVRNDAPRTVIDVAELLGLNKKTVERWLRGENLPGAQQLYAIAQVTKYSLKWLLDGTGSPQGDEAQQDVAVVIGRELQQRLEDSRAYKLDSRLTAGADEWLKRIPLIPDAPTELVRAVCDAWLEQETLVLGERLSLSMTQLADRMSRDAETVQDPREARALRRIATQMRRQATRLTSADDVITALQEFYDGTPLTVTSEHSLEHQSRSRLETSFPVLGASLLCGFAWYGATHDDVWCLRENSRKRVPEIFVCRKGRCLRAPEEREGQLPMGLEYDRPNRRKRN